MGPSERVAIVGIGGIFPGAPDLGRFWANVAGAIDATREVPAGRWRLDVADAYDPRAGTPDRVYATRGGFVEGFSLDPDGLDIDRDLLGRLDPMFLLALHAGRQAWRDAVTEGVDRRRVGVVLGNIVLPTETASALAWESLGRTFEERVGILGEATEPLEPLNAFVAGLPAGVVARALGLGGGAYTLDAACASSLYALKLAADELLAGRADAMLTGGLSRPDPLYTQMGFSQLRALSRTGTAAPFDARADGLVVGEGAGMFVLKRLGDALRHGDTIYGVVAAVGLSNDVHGGLLAPSSEGQLRAMRAAYDRAGWDPRDVDLIECHATGTPVGDAVEFESLRALWGDGGWSAGQCAIGSVKSNVGHTLTAAGSAGLLKVLLALKHRTLPPTANFHGPGPQLQYEASPFRVLTQPRPWEPREPGRPRRAAISGFGFGGINAHALIEEWIPPSPALLTSSSREGEGSAPIAIVGMAAQFGPFRGLREFQERVLGGDIAGAPAEPRHWWGARDAGWYRRAGLDEFPFRGFFLEDLAVQPDRFRIPPKELEEMLPQQTLMLQVAGEAIADAGWDDRTRLRAGVVLGIGLDLNATNFHVRWSLLNEARRWNETLELGLSGAALDGWTQGLRDAAGPPLTANRTMGALGGLIASRVAREFRIGGPSFTVSSEETSGLRALDVAVRLLRHGEIDEAIVGAVDLAGDLRAVLASHRLAPASRAGTVRPFDEEADGSIPGDGAAAVVLKRLDDAVRDGDRIYAVVRGLGSATGGGVDLPCPDAASYQAALRRGYADGAVAPASIGYLAAHGSGRPDEDRREAAALAEFARGWPEATACAFGAVTGDVGRAGAATGLAALVKAALCLSQQILPPLRGCRRLVPEFRASPWFVPGGPQFWLRDRATGPRRAAVSAFSIDGNCLHVVLEEVEGAGDSPDRLQPLGARRHALFALEADDAEGLLRAVDELEGLAKHFSESHVEALARRWWHAHPNEPGRRLGLALVADGIEALRDQLATARRRSGDFACRVGETHQSSGDPKQRWVAPTLQDMGGLAFVFPGLGNGFAGMGRELSAHWPEVFRALDEENQSLHAQMAPGLFWNGEPPAAFADHQAPILGQVALGTVVSDLLRGWGVAPEAVIGYSLGESAGLLALRAWTERDEMLRRIHESPLFRTELAGPCAAARRLWAIPAAEPVDWVAGVIPRPADEVRAALRGLDRVYLLIINSASEVVIGGRRDAVGRLVEALGGRFFALPVVSTVHCEVARAVEDAYRAMHRLRTTPPPGVRFYSGAWGRSYELDRETAADAIVAHAVHGIDYPAVIERAYADGIRVFLEVGPGASCTRLIDAILGDRPHLARSACVAGVDAVASILDLMGRLIAARIPCDLRPLYGRETTVVAHLTERGDPPQRTLRIAIGGRPFDVPRPPARPSPVKAELAADHRYPVREVDPVGPALPASAPDTAGRAGPTGEETWGPYDPLGRQLLATGAAVAEAHAAFLRASSGSAQTMSNQMAFQMALIEALVAEPDAAPVITPVTQQSFDDRRRSALALDRAQCLEFAAGSIGAVLGPEFAAVDAHPTRVRLPDEPLMLVDRILAIEGEPRSLSRGRVITAHDIRPGAWYLDGGRIPTCIAVEAGQADLFLAGFLGIDFETKGLAVYRLLDAVVTFHRGLPGPGEVIEYDIHIDGFFRQGDVYLFRFRFEGSVGGAALLTMRDGCAGFFTAEALAAGQGVVQTGLDRLPRPGTRPDDWENFVPMAVEAYDDRQVNALRRGDLATAFGPQFEGLILGESLRLPRGRMTLVHRVLGLDPAGGRYGLGSIRAEADIRPDDWFMTCHFVDDRVMPGTLMFECCLHTLRIFLLRMGWISESDAVACEPVPGIASRLKCRGQVTESTQKVVYEVAIKELGDRPEPYAIVDALMYADGKPIVEITDMSLRLTGLSREEIRRTWQRASGEGQVERHDGGAGDGALTLTLSQGERGPDSLPLPLGEGRGEGYPSGAPNEALPLFDRDRILAFAVGKPSEAFGAPYRVFDHDRVIARLPGPPYQFLDRITAIRAEPWAMVAGGEIEAQYDVPPDAWYCAADRQDRMPFAVLLEVALQPCGWLAAYVGSALTSEVDLSFRNLGGSAVQLEPIPAGIGTLTTAVRITRVSRSGGMIIQHYDFETSAAGRPVYRGDTYFGFFSKEALRDQVGLREAVLYQPGPEEMARARRCGYPTDPPFPDDRWRMIDRVEVFVPDGGPLGLGFIRGDVDVDPEAWFFRAHFHQDPVWPGSLGLESMQQLLKVAAAARWGGDPTTAFETMGVGDPHRWVYRGQVLPSDRRVTVQAVITAVDDRRRWLKADGFLGVDGRVIYQMHDFTLGLGATRR